MTDPVFPSRVDTWLAAVLVISALVALKAAVLVVLAGVPLGPSIAAVVMTFGIGLPVWLLRSTHYTVTAQDLRIVSGPFRWTIPLTDIRSVTPTRSPLSSPALSLERLRILYGSDKAIMVSPRDRDGFLAELARRGAVVTPEN